MSRTTPETDAKWQKLCCSNLSWYYIAKNIKTHCQKKERERDEAREEVKLWQRERDEAITRRMETIMQCELYEQERDEARENLRILAGLVAYGLGQSGEEWSLDAMRQATDAIQKAKALEGVK